MRAFVLLACLLGALCVNSVKGGLEMEVIVPGNGKDFPQVGQTVTVHYTGWLTNGHKFDSSRDRGDPFTFKLGVGQVIAGWDRGVARMSKGETANLTMTSDLGYGAKGAGSDIPPNSTLIFNVQLIDMSWPDDVTTGSSQTARPTQNHSQTNPAQTDDDESSGSGGCSVVTQRLVEKKLVVAFTFLITLLAAV